MPLDPTTDTSAAIRFVDRAIELGADRSDDLIRSGLAELGLAIARRRGVPDAALRRAAIAQGAHRLVALREIEDVLAVLRGAGIRVAPWKGVALAWPVPRPIGDLDLLVDEANLARAARLLVERGYRRAPDDRGGLFRRPPTGIELLPPPDRVTAVDLHARAFRSVGHRIDVRAILDRARPDVDPVDHALLVLVHAAKHALAQLKWRLDVTVVVDALSPVQLAELHHRARRSRTERPVALALLGAAHPSRILRGIVARRRKGALDAYALELLLEPGLRARGRMLVGALEARTHLRLRAAFVDEPSRRA